MLHHHLPKKKNRYGKSCCEVKFFLKEVYEQITLYYLQSKSRTLIIAL